LYHIFKKFSKNLYLRYNNFYKDVTQKENEQKDDARRKKEKKNGRNKKNAD